MSSAGSICVTIESNGKTYELQMGVDDARELSDLLARRVAEAKTTSINNPDQLRLFEPRGRTRH